MVLFSKSCASLGKTFAGLSTLLFTVMGLFACAAVHADAVKVQQLAQLTQCPKQFAQPGLTQIHHHDAPLTEAMLNSSHESDATYYVYSLGSKATPGYRVNIAQPTHQVTQEQLTIFIEQHSPAKGALLAQVLTRPCVIFAVSGQGDQQITVQNAE